jgi:hypothetical protein
MRVRIDARALLREKMDFILVNLRSVLGVRFGFGYAGRNYTDVDLER